MEYTHKMNPTTGWVIVIGNVRFITWMNHGNDCDEELNQLHYSHLFYQPNK